MQNSLICILVVDISRRVWKWHFNWFLVMTRKHRTKCIDSANKSTICYNARAGNAEKKRILSDSALDETQTEPSRSGSLLVVATTTTIKTANPYSRYGTKTMPCLCFTLLISTASKVIHLAVLMLPNVMPPFINHHPTTGMEQRTGWSPRWTASRLQIIIIDPNHW